MRAFRTALNDLDEGDGRRARCGDTSNRSVDRQGDAGNGRQSVASGRGYLLLAKYDTHPLDPSVEALGFEIYGVLSCNLRPYVHGCRLFLIGMTELEDHLGVTLRKSIHIANTTAQNERVVIKTEVGSIEKNDFSDLWPEPGLGIADEPSTDPLRRFLTMPKSQNL